MEKEESKPAKKKSILDISFTLFFLGFLAISSIVITFGAYNKGENILAIVFSFLAGVFVTGILSLDKKDRYE